MPPRLLRSSGCEAISLGMFSLPEHPNEFPISDMGGVPSWVEPPRRQPNDEPNPMLASLRPRNFSSSYLRYRHAPAVDVRVRHPRTRRMKFYEGFLHYPRPPLHHASTRTTIVPPELLRKCKSTKDVVMASINSRSLLKASLPPTE
jgi:hypothetical protein